MTQPAKTKSTITSHPWTSAAIAVLVLAGIVFTLYVPLYDSATPKVGDFPFFYFYLLIYFPALAIVMWAAILLQKRLAGTRATADDGTGTDGPSPASEVTR
jgi:hypothetical protein